MELVTWKIFVFNAILCLLTITTPSDSLVFVSTLSSILRTRNAIRQQTGYLPISALELILSGRCS